MRQLPSRLRRLDDALAALPLEEPMLLTELDGFLHGIVVCPEAIAPAEWFGNIWGIDDGDVPVFDDPADVRWFTDAVMARHDEIVRDLGRGKPRPVIDIDERNGEPLWEMWIDGFAEAMALRPDGWTAIDQGDDPEAAAAVSRLRTLIAVARNESDLDSMQINALQDCAATDMMEDVVRLYGARSAATSTVQILSVATNPAKAGRNDPCPCGSGKKFKRCCG
ncbi:uncharacterized protein SAMN05192583_2850 [Sphingomonas gellani]|uniref:YecA family protein n=1 Tax=Sphingomonas gellani TaxID=1166340 RepID=A0A1H8GQB1_9SPHN|nr:UPF0149 family protein [Sphingomonas gellani]SEN46020.1 uncharacterized protein SAMN05192583_2850 [Sphingomonas gellani]